MKRNLSCVAVIPDGNRRYAKKNGMPAIEGHKKGAEVLRGCLDFFRKKGVKEVIIYGLSEDNLKRPKEEIQGLFELYEREAERFLGDKSIHENEIKIEFLSTNPEALPKSLRDVISKLTDATKGYSRYVVRILLSWSAQHEIARAAYKAYEIARKGLPLPDIQKLLLVKSSPDLIIRTGEQSRMSDFLTIQSRYSEIYFTSKLFPEMSENDFKQAYDWFFKQESNIGR